MKIYDICIIGSGAGAGPIAYELSNVGFDVVVLEKGEFYKEEDFNKDEIAVSRRDFFTPNLKDEQHVIYEHKNNKITRKLGSEANWSFWNGSLVGGSSNLMSGYFHRLKPNDFKLKTTFGEIDGANVVDWVINYDDLEKYFTKVESVVGVSGKVVKHKFLEPRSTKNFPYEELFTNEASLWFDEACKKLNYESLPLARAILPYPSLDRQGCSYSNFCGSYGCFTGAKGSSRAALLQKCKAKILPNSFVYELKSNKKEITSALYFDKNKKSHEIKAKVFVLTAQAIETQRLLLNSKNEYFPNGISNNHNQVGKNLIFSAGGVGSGRLVFEKLNKKQQNALMQPGLFFNRSIQQWYEYEENNKRYKGGSIDFLFEHSNIISRAIREIYDENDNILWGTKLQEKIKKTLTTSRLLTYEIFNDWLPTDECYVTIEDGVKDKYGVSVGAIHLNSHPHDLKVGNFLATKANHILEQMGAVDIQSNISSTPPANLVAGGARFGSDINKSVLDKNCKSHELNNLYITDASFMPTGGSVPYTWSIYANSFRVADILKETLRKI